jgi:hypothetical protein
VLVCEASHTNGKFGERRAHRIVSREELWARLGRLPTRLRTAFTVGCAERVLCLHNLDCRPDDPRIKAAVDLAWRYASGGEPELEQIDVAEAGLREAIPRLDVPGGPTPAYMACMALAFALDAIDDPTAESALSGAFEALDAVDAFEDYFEPGSRTWSATEQAWQLRALAACESAGEAPAPRDLFAALGPHPPQWFRTRT